jgi:outer membrane protein assembly factor BamB
MTDDRYGLPPPPSPQHYAAPHQTSPPPPTLAAPTSPYWQPAPPSQPPQRRTRLPRRWLLPIAAATAVASVVAFVTGLMLPGGEEGTDPSGPLAFHRFASVARIAFDQQSRTTLTATLGDTVYTGWEQEGDLRMVAYDLATGEEKWRKAATGAPRWSRLIAAPDALLVLAYEASSSEPRRMFAHDPETGTLRWQIDVRGDDELFFLEGTIGWVDSGARVLHGLDAGTGGEQWSESFPDDGETRVIQATDTAELARPTNLLGEPVPGPSDPRLVMVNADRSVRVIDGSTGDTVTEGTNIAHPDDQLLAYGDHLFVAADEVGYQLLGYQLDQLTSTPRIFYTADTERYAGAIAACGTGRVCLLEAEQYDSATTEAMAVDATDGGVLWQSAAPEAERLIGVGQWVAAMVDSYEPSVHVFNGGGEPVYEGPGQATRLNDGNLILVTTDNEGGVLATGVSAADGTQIDLGRLSESLESEQCSWGDRFVACPDRNGTEIWSFADA